MRFIRKTGEPKEFTSWKALANPNWQPTFADLSGKVKQAVYQALLKEQGYICCYCEQKLTKNDYHIEHLNPQHKKAGDDLVYSNFLCSCLRNTEKGDPLHCGRLKDSNIIKVHPLQNNCQSKFTYTADGQIEGVDKYAKETIAILGLTIPKLVDMRKAVIEIFLDDKISNDEMMKFLKDYLNQTKDGKYNPFVSAVACIFTA